MFAQSPLLSSLVNILKVAANSVRKEHKLPDVALDLLRLALKENKFPVFWKEVLEEGLLKKPCWTSRCVYHQLPLPTSLGGACPEAHPKEQGL